MKDVYISTSGDDANDGATEGTAKATFGAALAVLYPGGTVHVGAGYHSAPSGPASIYIVGAGPAKPTIGGTSATSAWFQARELVARCRWSAARAELETYPDWLVSALDEQKAESASAGD